MIVAFPTGTRLHEDRLSLSHTHTQNTHTRTHSHAHAHAYAHEHVHTHVLYTHTHTPKSSWPSGLIPHRKLQSNLGQATALFVAVMAKYRVGWMSCVGGGGCTLSFDFEAGPRAGCTPGLAKHSRKEQACPCPAVPSLHSVRLCCLHLCEAMQVVYKAKQRWRPDRLAHNSVFVPVFHAYALALKSAVTASQCSRTRALARVLAHMTCRSTCCVDRKLWSSNRSFAQEI